MQSDRSKPRKDESVSPLRQPVPMDDSLSFGFLSVRRSDAVGYFGGLLTLNPLGRPLEFHCSLPIKPSRAQTILYGATLEDFLVGEQIALALVSKVRKRPKVLLTDITAALSLRKVHSTPIASLLLTADAEEPRHGLKLAPPSETSVDLHRFACCDRKWTTLAEFSDDCHDITAACDQLPNGFDLDEPFARILYALAEANPAVKSAA